ncbi:MAG: response regulator transcription factor [Deltaproteobacteria bacterium]|nr:response regulator transcription factor [Deltaproteobacteria bacterium]
MELSHRFLIANNGPDKGELIANVLLKRIEVLTAFDGEEAIAVARKECPDAILLDEAVSKIDGISACRILRDDSATRDIPIVLLTSLDDSASRLEAYENGVDDCIQRPYLFDELLARVLSKIRRFGRRAKPSAVITCGNLQMHTDSLETRVAGKVVDVSVLEFKLLKFFVENRDRVLDREIILRAVWKDEPVNARTVDTHIFLLRKELKGADYHVSTIYGAGYIFKKRFD